MRRLFGWMVGVVLILSAGFALLILAARAVRIAQPLPEALAQLHLTDCALPCWLGITPGKTHIEEAVQRVNVAYPLAAPTITNGRVVNADTPFGQVIMIADSTGIVHRISLPAFKLKGVTLADAVSLLGTPTWVVGVHPVAVYYGCETYLVVVSGSSVDGGWRQSLVIIDIQDVGYSCPIVSN